MVNSLPLSYLDPSPSPALKFPIQAENVRERAKSIFGLQIPSYLLAHILNSFSSSVANGEEGGLDGEREQSSHLSQAQRGHREAGTGST